MTRQKQNQDGKDGHSHSGPKGKSYETYYEDEKSGAWNFNATEAVCGVIGGLRDSVLKTLPVEVTEHLVNGEKELIKAGIALAESQMRTADGVLNRARDLRKEKAEKS